MEPPTILVRLFGTPSIVVEGKTITSFRSNRIPALFALLSSRPGSWSREVVAAMLWPDSAEEDARHNLRQILLYIKQMLGEHAVVASRQSISLGPGVHTSLRSALRVHDSLLSPDEALSVATEAISGFQGPLLPGFDDEWLDPIRYQCNHAYVAALVRLSDHFVHTDPRRALEHIDLAIQVEPFLENLRAKKIQILVAMGEQASAHRELANFRKFLDQELGIEPSKVASEALSAGERTEPPSDIAPKTVPVEDPIDYLLRSSRPSRGLQLAIDMASYWSSSGSYQLGIDVLRRAIDLSRGSTSKDLEWRALIEIAGLLIRQVRFFEAQQILDRVLTNATMPSVRLAALTNFLRLHIYTYHTGQAQAILAEALQLVETFGAPEEVMDVYRWASEIEIQFGDLESGRRHAEQCADLARQMGDWNSFATSISQVAVALARSDRPDEANRAIRTGLLELQDKIGRHAAFTRGRFSRILEELGENDLAEQGYRRAIDDARKYEDFIGLAVALTYLGDLLHASGRNEEALGYHEEALAIRREMHEQLGEATSLRGIGRILLANGRLEEARDALRESSRLFVLCDAEPGHASALLELARVDDQSGDPERALRIAIRARDLLVGMPTPLRLQIGPTGDRLADDADQLVKALSSKLGK